METGKVAINLIGMFLCFILFNIRIVDGASLGGAKACLFLLSNNVNLQTFTSLKSVKLPPRSDQVGMDLVTIRDGNTSVSFNGANDQLLRTSITKSFRGRPD